MSATYARGTKTARRTTKALQPGDVVLTEDSARENGAKNTATKTGAVLRTVAGTEYVAARRELGERNRRITVSFTDGTTAQHLAPAETWTVVEAPVVEAEEPAIVKAGEAAPLAQHEAPAQDAPAPSACPCCGRPSRKGNYLPGHDAKHASRLVSDVLTQGRDIHMAVREIPARYTKLIAKVFARVA